MGRWASQPLVSQARTYPRPLVTASDHEWARTTARGLCVVGDLAEILGVGDRWARRLLLRSHYPRTLLTRKWCDPSTGIKYRRTLWVFPPEVVALIILDRLARFPKRTGRTLSPRWRQRTQQLRRRLQNRYPMPRENSA